MTCHICCNEIHQRQQVEYHRPTYKSRGGTQTAPTHKRCHRKYHQQQGDYREWGRKSAQAMRWAWNLKNVRTHPAYEDHRWVRLMSNGLVGWAEGLI
ncbi:MAG: hypothetical protein ACJ74G_13515 [Blastocatellia bacterium]